MNIQFSSPLINELDFIKNKRYWSLTLRGFKHYLICLKALYIYLVKIIILTATACEILLILATLFFYDIDLVVRQAVSNS